jgi:hypothetical protein
MLAEKRVIWRRRMQKNRNGSFSIFPYRMIVPMPREKYRGRLAKLISLTEETVEEKRASDHQTIGKAIIDWYLI